MARYKIKEQHGPEWHIQKSIVEFLRGRGWFVKELTMSLFTQGLPDLYIAKRSYGSRWVEVKNPTAYRFTPAQLETFPRMSAEGIGIWILTAATEAEYNKLFQPPNWWTFLYTPDMNK